MVGENMRTTITINENYQIIERRIESGKKLPNKFLDLIILIIKNNLHKEEAIS